MATSYILVKVIINEDGEEKTQDFYFDELNINQDRDVKPDKNGNLQSGDTFVVISGRIKK